MMANYLRSDHPDRQSCEERPRPNPPRPYPKAFSRSADRWLKKHPHLRGGWQAHAANLRVDSVKTAQAAKIKRSGRALHKKTGMSGPGLWLAA